MMIGSNAAVSVTGGHQLPLKPTNSDAPAPGTNLASYLRTVLQAYVISRAQKQPAVPSSSSVSSGVLGRPVGLSTRTPKKPLAKWNWQKSCRKAARLSSEPVSEASEPGTSALLLKCEHWLEATDPKHRYGSHLRPYYTKWLSQQPDDLDGPPSSEDFFCWLDVGPGRAADLAVQGVSRVVLEASRVRYLSYEERGHYEVEVDASGLLRYKTTGHLVHTQEDATADDLVNLCPTSCSTAPPTKRSIPPKHSALPPSPTAPTTTTSPIEPPVSPRQIRLHRRAASAPGDAVPTAEELADISSSSDIGCGSDTTHSSTCDNCDAAPKPATATTSMPHPPQPHLTPGPAKGCVAAAEPAGAAALVAASPQSTAAGHALVPASGSTQGPLAASSEAPGATPASRPGATPQAGTRCTSLRSTASGKLAAAQAPSVRFQPVVPAERSSEPSLAAMLFARQQALLEAQPQVTPQGKKEKCGWIYVMDITHRIYIHRKQRGLFHHSSFVCGAAVLAAGGLDVRHGRIDKLSAHSGHYRPDEGTFLAFVEYLKEQGADLQFTRILGVSKGKGELLKDQGIGRKEAQRGALLMRRNSF